MKILKKYPIQQTLLNQSTVLETKNVREDDGTEKKKTAETKVEENDENSDFSIIYVCMRILLLSMCIYIKCA